MLFNSIDFLVFFPLVTALYFILPQRLRMFMLLVASCVFYMFFIPAYILILILTILIDYFMGIAIENSTDNGRRKLYLIISIVSTCAVLFVFKYFNFFIGNYNEIASFLHWNHSIDMLKMILPIGLSFHTFQSLSYVIEIYYKRQKTERNFILYSLYVMYYPQLVAGPIERPQNILPQLHKEHPFDYERVVSGLRLMLWGFFKKVVIADRVSYFANAVFDQPDQYAGWATALGVLFFTFQIYCDFSGYSDIALGASEIMGIKLMTNFRRPYLSSSIAEFWSRWHISLSTWFRDYVYIPLGGNRVNAFRRSFNVFVVFLVSGFWHGANWTFLVWGGLHGLYTTVENLLRPVREYILNRPFFSNLFFKKIIPAIITFVLVWFAWIFFRASSIDAAFHLIERIFSFEQSNLSRLIQLDSFNFYAGILLIIALMVFDLLHHRFDTINEWWMQLPAWQRWTLYYVLLAAIILFGVYGEQQFIYFQF